MASRFRARAALAVSFALFLPFAAPRAGEQAPPPARHHALSLIGEPEFGPDFKHFDWVNPDAPKGGATRLFAFGSFDNLNPFTIKGLSAAGLGMTFDTLMAPSLDEPATEYALIAEWASYPDDYSSVTFGLRPEARFHDGRPITPEDVIFSLETLKKINPRYGFYYANVAKAEKTGEREVTFTFDKGGNRELPQIVGELPILPKHFWDALGANGEARDPGRSTLEPLLGSGPYKIKAVDSGRSIVYERVADYWAKDLPVNAGQWNFDEIKYDYFRDKTPGFEAFKSGQIDYWEENSATAWAAKFDFPALRKGQVSKEALPHKRVVGMQAFAFNTRRAQFQDPRVRHAFNLAFNFEQANKTLFYDQYIRSESFFGNSELQAKGLPEGRELDLLTALKDQVPPEVFTTEWKNPVSADPAAFRQHLLEAKRLLEEAGWTLRDERAEDPGCGFFCKMQMAVGLRSAQSERVLRNARGETLDAEFLLASPEFERIVLPFVEALRSLGVNAVLRLIDSSQYERRARIFDYDVIVDTFGQSHSPGNEQRDFWGSATAGREGSQNSIGVSNPAVDKLVDEIVFARSRGDLVAAARALDRVLLWSHYVVPQWHYPFERVAIWKRFGRPEKLPSQNPSAFERLWWFDAAKSRALDAAGG